MGKKIFIILIMLLITGIVSAQQQVSKSEARNAAINTFYNKIEVLVRSVNTEVDTIYSFSNSRSNILMYEVVFKNRAAILLSGSKACLPILGYYIKAEHDNASVFDTTNENVPDGLQTLLFEYTQQIEWCFNQRNIELYYEEQWNELQDNNSSRTNPPTRMNVAPLLKSKWGQSRSNNSDCQAYNYYAPASSSCPCGHCLAGCVAVAMGQIINYWKYPDSYNWCHIPDYLNTSFPNYEQLRNETARLIRNCGMHAIMNYCDGGDCESSAIDLFITSAFIINLGYSDDLDLQRRAWHLDSKWKKTIKEDLDKGRPVYYSGRKSTGAGHAFVCDGYCNDDMFHFNFGKLGSGDGWYTINTLPLGNDYNSTQHAIFHIHPDPEYIRWGCIDTLKLFDYYMMQYGILKLMKPPLPEYLQNVPKNANVLISLPESPFIHPDWYIIKPGMTVEYVAHKEIILQPGFRAMSGAYFSAHLEPCPVCTGLASSKSATFINEDQTETFNFEIEKEPIIKKSNFNYNNSASIKLYPNPNNGKFYLENIANEEILKITITNDIGQIIHEKINFWSGELEIPNAKRGVYYVIIALKDTIIAKRIIVK